MMNNSFSLEGIIKYTSLLFYNLNCNGTVLSSKYAISNFEKYNNNMYNIFFRSSILKLFIVI